MLARRLRLIVPVTVLEYEVALTDVDFSAITAPVREAVTPSVCRSELLLMAVTTSRSVT